MEENDAFSPDLLINIFKSDGQQQKCASIASEFQPAKGDNYYVSNFGGVCLDGAEEVGLLLKHEIKLQDLLQQWK